MDERLVIVAGVTSPGEKAHGQANHNAKETQMKPQGQKGCLNGLEWVTEEKWPGSELPAKEQWPGVLIAREKWEWAKHEPQIAAKQFNAAAKLASYLGYEVMVLPPDVHGHAAANDVLGVFIELPDFMDKDAAKRLFQGAMGLFRPGPLKEKWEIDFNGVVCVSYALAGALVGLAVDAERDAAQAPSDDDSEWTFMGKDMRWSKFWQMRHELRQRNGRYFTEPEILELVAEARREAHAREDAEPGAAEAKDDATKGD